MTNDLVHPFVLVAKAIGCEPKDISDNSGMYRDYGWDSLGHVSVIVALEKHYHITINDEMVEKFKKMSEILKYYEELKKERNRA